jgi:hypothetical protein
VDGELLKIFVKLSLGSGEAIKDDTLGGFWLLDFLVYDLHNDFVADEATGLDNAFDGFDEHFVKPCADGSFKDFADLISRGDVVVAEVLAEKLGIGALADSGRSEEEEEFLLAGAEVIDNSLGESLHVFQ